MSLGFRQLSPKRVELLVALALFIWASWLAAPYLAFGPMSYVRIHDCGDSVLPTLLSQKVSTDTHGFYAWNYWGCCGSDGPQTWHQMLFSFLPGWLAYGTFTWFERFVAGYFTYRLLRESLLIDLMPALASALAYSLYVEPAVNNSLTGFTLYHGFGLPALPFFVWILYRLRPPYRWWAFVVGFGLGILLAMGCDYPFAMFLLPCIIVWFLVLTPRFSPLFWLVVGVFLMAWVIGELPSAIPAVLVAPLSHRAHWPAESPLDTGSKFSIAWGLMADNLWPIALAIVGFAVGRGRNRPLVRWLACLFACLLFLAFYRDLRRLLFSHLGFLAGFQFDRIYMVVPFMAFVAAALGIQALPSAWRAIVALGPSRSLNMGLRGLLAAAAILFVARQSWAVNKHIRTEMASGATYADLYLRPQLQELAAKERLESPFRVASVADAGWHPSFAWAYGLESADGYLNLYPNRYHDYWEQVMSPLFATDTNRYSYFHYWGNRVYLFAPSKGFPEDREADFAEFYRLELLSLANVRYIISSRPLHHPDLVLQPSNRLAQQLVWKSLSLHKKILACFAGQFEGAPLYIYENKQACPRFFAVTQLKVLSDDTEVLRSLREASCEELRSTAYLSKSDTTAVPRLDNGAMPAKVRLLRYSANRIDLEVETQGTAIVVNSTTYSPCWKAQIDSIAAEILPVDHTLQGVAVPPGTHRVCFKYEPPFAGLSWASHKDE